MISNQVADAGYVGDPRARAGSMSCPQNASKSTKGCAEHCRQGNDVALLSQQQGQIVVSIDVFWDYRTTINIQKILESIEYYIADNRPRQLVPILTIVLFSNVFKAWCQHVSSRWGLQGKGGCAVFIPTMPCKVHWLWPPGVRDTDWGSDLEAP